MIDVHLDFETFSELDVRRVGACRYAEHPSTEVLCLAWAVGDEEPHLWQAGDPPPRRLFRLARRRDVRFWAWNADFELSVWLKVCVPRLKWPPIMLGYWRDAAALALSFALPAKLEGAVDVLDVDEKKDPRGDRLVHKLCKPRRPSKNNPATRWTPETAPEDFEALGEYCRQDVRAERAILRALPADDLPPDELATWRLTTHQNFRGWHVDEDSVRRLLALLDEHRPQLHAELKEITGGAVETANQVAKLRAWLSDNDLPLPDLQAETVEQAIRGALPGPPRRALEIRAELAKASVAKFEKMLEVLCDDGTVKNTLMYHGAATGRDAGRLVQIQNLVRGAISKTEEGVEAAFETLRLPRRRRLRLVKLLYGSPTTFASLLCRSVLTARPGCELFSGDYSSIENRVAVWFAGSEYGLGIFRRGLDQYKLFASAYYGVEYDDVEGWQRDHAKRAVLLCVYGGGYEALMRQAEQYGTPCTEEVARGTVRTYRRDLYPEIGGPAGAWYALERAARDAVLSPGRETGYESDYAAVSFRVRSGFLFLELPSGRRLAYYDPQVRMRFTPWGERRPTVTHMGVSSKTHKWVRQNLIPGRIFENVVQAISRDLMMAGARAVDEAGYEPVGRVHDELINERRKGEGDLDEYLGLMVPRVPWFRGCPLAADGWAGYRYRK